MNVPEAKERTMHPDITRDSLVRDIAQAHPETVAVFQRHELEFCCAGKIPIAEACRDRGIDVTALLGEIDASLQAPAEDVDWRTSSLTSLVQHIHRRYHEPLREELPRLAGLLARVIARHGERYPKVLERVHTDFHEMANELIHHLQKEEVVLFPAILALEAAVTSHDGRNHGQWAWIDQPIRVMEDDHGVVGAKLASIRQATAGYALPADACSTFRGLFHGLEQLERELTTHIALEDEILFPRAVEFARATMG
jgi:regulator of cell morphogenesis and NO signaling